jgi:Calcium binding
MPKPTRRSKRQPSPRHRTLSRAAPRKQPRREKRIRDEIVVDAYGPEERAMGWWAYLDDTLRFPFQARCLIRRAISPLRVGETVSITGMAADEDCVRDILVLTQLADRTFGVPLRQLKPLNADAQTVEAIADWHYWCEMGYSF